MTSGNCEKLIRTALGVTLAGLLIVVMAPLAAAQEDLGEDVDGRNCVGCHQPDGEGLTGNFPPLAGNANVQDAAYVEDVIRNGKQGELVVNGVTYNGVMPAFGQLSDEEIAAVIDYVQNRLGVSGGGEGGAPVEEGETFPWNLVMLGSVQTVFVVAYGRAILIFLFFGLATAWLPSWTMTQDIIAGAPRLVGDLIGSGLWMVMLGAGIGALIWLQRTERI